jgi:hypothetical protein
MLAAGTAVIANSGLGTGASFAAANIEPNAARVRPGDAAWPNAAQWDGLSKATGGRLIEVQFPLADAIANPDSAATAQLFKDLKNPFFIGDIVGLTQTLGWTDAWTTRPSVYAVAAETSTDVAAAVNFAREHRLRLVVKGGGHSYLGGSNAPDSLMVWTRRMNAVSLHDAFTPQGCKGRVAPGPAVSIGAGAIWLQAYDAVTTQAGRYVQGGGCTTVGVAGLVQGGGFGSFSKAFGSGAANLLEAEVVTADGVVRIANPCTNPDLFFALKGGGGGSFGVVTRLTLRTHDLPTVFGAVSARIEAKSDAAYRRLVGKVVSFYATTLFNPHWGEQIRFRGGDTVNINMVFQGVDQKTAQAAWKPFFDWVKAAPDDYKMGSPLIVSLPARHFWDAHVMKSLGGIVKGDDRPNAPAENFFWAGDGGQVGQVIHSYQSAWLPQGLLQPGRQAELVDALVRTSQIWGVSLHVNKGLAGGAPEAVARTRETSMNPAAADAFALAITGGEEQPAYPGVKGHEPDVTQGRADAVQIARCMEPLRRLQPTPATYISECDYFEKNWREAFWGSNYARLRAAKLKYDPGGLFVVHHGVGSEDWSADGFTRLG